MPIKYQKFRIPMWSYKLKILISVLRSNVKCQKIERKNKFSSKVRIKYLEKLVMVYLLIYMNIKEFSSLNFEKKLIFVLKEKKND